MKENAAFAEEIRHGGIDGLIGSGDLQPDLPEHGRDSAHAGSGDPEEVEVFKMSAIQHGTPLRMEDGGSGVEQNP